MNAQLSDEFPYQILDRRKLFFLQVQILDHDFLQLADAGDEGRGPAGGLPRSFRRLLCGIVARGLHFRSGIAAGAFRSTSSTGICLCESAVGTK